MDVVQQRERATQIVVRMRLDQRQRIRDAAAEAGETMSTFVRSAVAERMQQDEQRKVSANS